MISFNIGVLLASLCCVCMFHDPAPFPWGLTITASHMLNLLLLGNPYSLNPYFLLTLAVEWIRHRLLI